MTPADYSWRASPVARLLALAVLVQLGIGAWRMKILVEQGIRAGARPVVWSAGVAAEIGLALALGALAWWWLPRGRRRSATQWAAHLLVLAWTLALMHYAVGLFDGLDRSLTWSFLALLAALGALVRRRSVPEEPPHEPPLDRLSRAALWVSAGLWLALLPHLFFPYHWMDARLIWACRAQHFDLRGSFAGVFDCPGPERVPLHSVLLWLGHANPVMEGRLLPIVLVGAFGIVFYALARRAIPRLAPWALLWLFATNRVYQGAINAYADVPVMIAVALALMLAVDDGRILAPRRLALAAAVVAGAAATLIKRDGLAMIGVGTLVLLWTAERRRDPRLWAPLAGGLAAYASWAFRPEWLSAPPGFVVRLEDLQKVDLASLGRALWTIFYGMQGQLLSHYAFGVFALAWIVLAVWLVRSGAGLPGGLARRLGLAGLAGWATVAALYVGAAFVGNPEMGTLFVIRTGFSRHLVHMFPLCLLFAAAMVERLLVARPAR